MLKNEINSRLDEFIIIERSGVVQTWVKHISIGDHRSGQCYSRKIIRLYNITRIPHPQGSIHFQ